MEVDVKVIEFIAECDLTQFEITSLYTLFFGIEGVVDMFCYQNVIELKYNFTRISKIEMFQFITDLGIESKKIEYKELGDSFFQRISSASIDIF